MCILYLLLVASAVCNVSFSKPLLQNASEGEAQVKLEKSSPEVILVKSALPVDEDEDIRVIPLHNPEKDNVQEQVASIKRVESSSSNINNPGIILVKTSIPIVNKDDNISLHNPAKDTSLEQNTSSKDVEVEHGNSKVPQIILIKSSVPMVTEGNGEIVPLQSADEGRYLKANVPINEVPVDVSYEDINTPEIILVKSPVPASTESYENNFPVNTVDDDISANNINDKLLENYNVGSFLLPGEMANDDYNSRYSRYGVYVPFFQVRRYYVERRKV